MDQDELKTSWKTRIVIGLIGFLLLFSTVAVYALIVLSSEKEKQTNTEMAAELAEVEKELTAKREELEAEVSALSDKYFDKLKGYKSRVKPFNAQAVNDNGLKTTDIETGSGAAITDETSYYSYYIGWCPDESIFDSSFNSIENPTALVDPISYTAGVSNFVAGWEEGVIGMKLGGVRQLEIPGELAYGNEQEMCGMKNAPLKFIVMTVEPGEAFEKKLEEYNKVYEQYIILYYSQNQDLLYQE